ncbi:MAG: pyridoxine 5'-phosphate synthase [Candidatus Aerophobetes bacterium]|nr:pyridoxine 5'-phosphate synthase [Candidatus Aerophobetes bacterium]
MPELNVDISDIAVLRQKSEEPDPVAAAILAELGGAKGISVYLREDERYIREKDLNLLRATIKTNLNLEMGVNEKAVKIVLNIKPDLATIVPEKKEEITQGGLSFSKNNLRLKEVISLLHERGSLISLLVNPDSESIKKAHKWGADIVQLHTGLYAASKNYLEAATQLEKIAGAAILAKKIGLGVSAGCGLNYHNIKKLCLIEDIEEFTIGHSIISRACLVGIKEAVKEMVNLIKG